MPAVLSAVLACAAISGYAQPVSAAECNGDYGTEVDFVDSPAEAAKQALKQEKLVFVLHVSGDFENPEFT
jgi:hypothetical protein